MVLAAAFASLGLLATIFAFSLRGANLTGDASGMIDPEMLSLLWATPVGTAFMRFVLGLSLLISRFIPWAYWNLDLRVGWRHCRLGPLARSGISLTVGICF